MNRSRYITLPIDYEKEFHEAKSKLQHHMDRVSYHKALVSHYEQQVEELEPLTDNYERGVERARKEREGSEEFIAVRKKIKRTKANALVDIMLRRIAQEDV